MTRALHFHLDRSIWLGTATGIHVTAGPAALSWSAMTGELPLDDSPFSVLGQPDVTVLLFACAATEILVDKLPVLPPRTSAGPLAGRLVVGAVMGVVAAVGSRRSWIAGGILGGCAAGFTAFAGTSWRRFAAHLGVPDPVAALADSTSAVLLARRGMGPVVRDP